MYHWVADGYQHLLQPQLQFGPADFPLASALPQPEAEDLLRDLCYSLHLPHQAIELQWLADGRTDSATAMHQYSSELVPGIRANFSAGRIVFELQRDMREKPQRIAAGLATELIGISLLSELGTEGHNNDEIIATAAIFCGFGVLLANGLCHELCLCEQNGARQVSAPISKEILGYALACDAWFRGDAKPAWRAALPLNCRHYFEKSLELLEQHGPCLNKCAIADGPHDPEEMFQEACSFAQAGNIDASNEVLQKLVFLDADNSSIYFNNLGYNLLRSARYQESIAHFRSAIKSDPENPYPFNNLGLALIMCGQHNEGLQKLREAHAMPGDHEGFYFRNLGVYYSQTGSYDKACSYFERARSFVDVDDLDFYQGLHLIKRGDRERGLQLLNGAAAMGCRKAKRVLAEHHA